MRSYQSGTKEKNAKRQKALYWSLFAIFAVVVALIITLSVTLGGQSAPVSQTPDPGQNVEVPPVTTPTEPTFSMPIETYTVGNGAVLDRLVYNSSMNHFRTHNGQDFLAAEGSVVRSVSDGRVISVQMTQLEAGVIKIEHANGVVSVYKGLSADMNVEVGDTVEEGGAIGTLNASLPFERSVGTHLHLEMEKDGKLVNPNVYLSDLQK